MSQTENTQSLLDSISKDELTSHLSHRLGGKVTGLKITELGKGLIGTGYLLQFWLDDNPRRLVLKTISTQELGFDHLSDKARNFLLAHDSYNSMKNHVKSVDVLSVKKSGKLSSVSDSQDFFILMEEATGEDMFADFEQIRRTGKMTAEQEKKVLAVSDFLAELHSRKQESRTRYLRKIRDTISGSNGSILEVLDTYPTEYLEKTRREWNRILQLSLRQWELARQLTHRTAEIHGDFHPGNILFDGDRMTLLDRSRGMMGEPADDLTAFLVNPILYSVADTGKLSQEFKRMFKLFWDNYITKTGDTEVTKIMGVFFAFRVAVVCNPVFYPDSFFGSAQRADAARKSMMNFARNVLTDSEFRLDKLNDYFFD